jgi:sarcosine oxidase
VRQPDVIVIGTGGIGSAALWHLARRGVRVLGLDRFPVAHARGSSHGQTRLIRQAYYEHTDYVPLLQRAYALWRELERQVARPLLVESGLVMAGPPEGAVIAGALDSARQHRLEVEHLPGVEATGTLSSSRQAATCTSKPVSRPMPRRPRGPAPSSSTTWWCTGGLPPAAA